MWAVVNKETDMVVACFPIEPSQEERINKEKENYLIKMTLDNSPAWIKGYYKDGKFYPPTEMKE
jgi:hypothetical protein